MIMSDFIFEFVGHGFVCIWLHVAGGCILVPWLSSNSLVTISK